MASRSKANDFLAAMSPEPEAAERAAPAAKPRAAKEPAKAASAASTRAGLKHIGGYFDRETVEKVAVLRARLDLDNSELIKLAIEELHRKHMAKRAYGDA
jgi:hypothetical protein